MSVTQIRAFIAIKLPYAVRAYLEEKSTELQDNVPPSAVRWVRPENIHLTLRFLGDTPLDKLPALAAGMDHITERRLPFDLRLDNLGTFPNPRRPRVIWVGLSGDLEQLHDLHKAINQVLLPLGWKPENRRFHPHLTLGRVKDSRPVIQARLPWGATVDAVEYPVYSVHLIESQLKPTGAIYSTRYTSELAGK